MNLFKRKFFPIFFNIRSYIIIMISLIIRILFNHPINDSLEQYVQVEVRIKVLEYIKDYYKNKIVNVQLKEIIEIKNNNSSDFENYIILLKIYYDIVLYSL